MSCLLIIHHIKGHFFFLSSSTFPSLVITALCLSPSLLFAEQEGVPGHKITLGTYWSSGDYGVRDDTDIFYIPLSYELSYFPWIITVTVPYLGLEGPGDVFLETGNIGSNTGNGEFIDQDGVGDTVLSATYQFEPLFKDRVFMDLTLETKFPTADEQADLGTGEQDYAAKLDFYVSQGKATWFSTLGYRYRGKTALYDLEDSIFASLGYMRQMSDKSYLGLLYDYRERASGNGFESHEIMPFVTHNLTEKITLMAYTIIGFTNSSADRTLGLQVSYAFQ